MSYSRHDEDLVKPLARILGAGGDSVFVDVDNVRPGDLWREEIEAAVLGCAVFILCWCCEGNRSEFVAREIILALQNPKTRFVPVLLCNIPLPESLREHQWVNFAGTFKHSCSHGAPNAPKSRLLRTIRQVRPTTLAAVMTVLLLATTFLVGLRRMRLDESTSDTSIRSQSTTEYECYYRTGPKAGQTEWAQNDPAPNEHFCRDGYGNVGVVRSRRTMRHNALKGFRDAPSTSPFLLFAVALLAGAVTFGLCIALISVSTDIRDYLRHAPNRVAAMARTYFEDPDADLS